MADSIPSTKWVGRVPFRCRHGFRFDRMRERCVWGLIVWTILARGQAIDVNRPEKIGVSGPPAIWSEISAAPDDERSLIACGMWLLPDRTAQGFLFASRDGGKTWRQTLHVKDQPFISEESCVLGFQGRAYFTAGAGDGRSKRFARHRLYRSLDSGKTWLPFAESAFADMATLTVDSGRSRYRGTLYAAANGFSVLGDGRRERYLELYRAGENDSELSGPVVQPRPFLYELGASFPGNVRVGADGTVYAAYHIARLKPGTPLDKPESFERTVEVIRSDDGGRSWKEPVIVARFDGWGLPDEPVLAADPRDRNRILAVWTTFVSGVSRIAVSESKDRASTWSAPRYIDDIAVPSSVVGERIGHVAFPSVAFAQNGIAGVSWFDVLRRCWRFQASLGGTAFSASAPFSSCGLTAPGPFRGGEYGFDRHWRAGLTVDSKNVFHPIWMEGGQLLTTRIRVRAK
jgi:hypothetical protein